MLPSSDRISSVSVERISFFADMLFAFWQQLDLVYAHTFLKTVNMSKKYIHIYCQTFFCLVNCSSSFLWPFVSFKVLVTQWWLLHPTLSCQLSSLTRERCTLVTARQPLVSVCCSDPSSAPPSTNLHNMKIPFTFWQVSSPFPCSLLSFYFLHVSTNIRLAIPMK